ncbi:hypothetical protein O181_039411 [Austropuccinia psidii MF-1]|uniref:Uncharacterized protein n=1 Tax=Austropuccinia psidii MF-1 TaxID=1389203 RepID=A0A9Q3D9N1_9BASI|nr:hypothetical protein [Austropuccinia psidii MF-1]
MSTPSQPLCIEMVNLCSRINRDISLHTENSHLDSWIILWHNQHIIFVYLPNFQHTIGPLPETLSKILIPFLGEPQTFIHCGTGGAWIENFKSNPTKTLFVEGVLITDQHDSSPYQRPHLALMFSPWYPKILFIIESFRKQDFKLKMAKEYYCDSHSQCQLFTPTPPSSKLTPTSCPAVFALSSKQKLIQLPSCSDLPIITLPHQKTGIAFLWD